MKTVSLPLERASTLAEERIVLHNVSWSTYEALLHDLGDRGGIRVAYDRGNLEIMSPHLPHEKLKGLIRRLIEAFADETGLGILNAGSTTLKSHLRQRGVEPDECYYIRNESIVRAKIEIDLAVDPPPDLAIEIDIKSSSVDKLGIYAVLRVPELWRHDGKKLIVYHLQAAGDYVESAMSAALPGLPLEELARCLDRRDADAQSDIVREFRARIRERQG